MRSNLQLKAGIILMIICVVVYSAALILPFLNVPTSVKLTLVPAGIIIGEIAFWGGAFFLGKELVKKYRSYLNPLRWLGRGKEKDPSASFKGGIDDDKTGTIDNGRS
jgi:hypothetical protein